jgi:hypothetical protein
MLRTLIRKAGKIFTGFLDNRRWTGRTTPVKILPPPEVEAALAAKMMIFA